MNAVFIHIPKTAGRYIVKALSLESLIYPHKAKQFTNTGKVTFGHQDYPSLIKKGIVSKRFDRLAFKFCFCRNPFDRVVSHYFYTRKRHPDILHPSITFHEFIKNLDKYNIPMKYKGRVAGKKVFRPQYDQIAGVDMSFIGRFETLQQDLKYISIEIDAPITYTKKVGTTDHNHYSTYYTEDLAEIVRNYYRIDFEKFGYDYNLHNG